VERSLPGPSCQLSLYSAVLIAKRYLEVIDVFAVTLKAKVSWLNDASMDRANGYFVNFFALNAEEIGYTNLCPPAVRRARSAFVHQTIGLMKTEWLEPWMSLGHNAPLFSDLPFKQVNLRALGAQGWVLLARERCRSTLKHSRLVIRQNDKKGECFSVWRCKEGAYPLAASTSVKNAGTKSRPFEKRQIP